MFLVDVSPSMGKMREVEVPLANGEVQVVEMTNMEWALQFVKLKVQEMVSTGCSSVVTSFISLADIQWSQDRSVRGHLVWYTR